MQYFYSAITWIVKYTLPWWQKLAIDCASKPSFARYRFAKKL